MTCRPEQKVAAPAKGSMHQVEGAHLSAEPESTAVLRSDDVSAKPSSESAASSDHGKALGFYPLSRPSPSLDHERHDCDPCV